MFLEYLLGISVQVRKPFKGWYVSKTVQALENPIFSTVEEMGYTHFLLLL